MNDDALNYLHQKLEAVSFTDFDQTAFNLAFTTYELTIKGAVKSAEEVVQQSFVGTQKEMNTISLFFQQDLSMCVELVHQANLQLIKAPFEKNNIKDYSKIFLDVPCEVKLKDKRSVYYLRQTIVKEFIPKKHWKLLSFWKRLDFIRFPAFHIPTIRCFDPELVIFMQDKRSQSKFTLSKREAEVYELVQQGYNSKKIADLLVISIHTVNTHRKMISKKIKKAAKDNE